MTTTEPATVDHERLLSEVAATTEGMAALIAWHTEHPDLSLQQCGLTWVVATYEMDDLDDAAIVRAIADGAPVGAVKKKAGKGDIEGTLFIVRDFGGGVELSHHADRERVCERVVTGTETVEIPDPDAPKVTVEREIVEWKCAPILAGADA